MPHEEQVAQLGEPVAQPPPIPLRELNERGGEEEELFGIDLRETLGECDVRAENRGAGYAKRLADAAEHVRSRVTDSSGFQLGDLAS